jgi:hypothetical protein
MPRMYRYNKRSLVVGGALSCMSAQRVCQGSSPFLDSEAPCRPNIRARFRGLAIGEKTGGGMMPVHTFTTGKGWESCLDQRRAGGV